MLTLCPLVRLALGHSAASLAVSWWPGCLTSLLTPACLHSRTLAVMAGTSLQSTRCGRLQWARCLRRGWTGGNRSAESKELHMFLQLVSSWWRSAVGGGGV